MVVVFLVRQGLLGRSVYRRTVQDGKGLLVLLVVRTTRIVLLLLLLLLPLLRNFTVIRLQSH